jgi:hypothetical protein
MAIDWEARLEAEGRRDGAALKDDDGHLARPIARRRDRVSDSVVVRG